MTFNKRIHQDRSNEQYLLYLRVFPMVFTTVEGDDQLKIYFWWKWVCIFEKIGIEFFEKWISIYLFSDFVEKTILSWRIAEVNDQNYSRVSNCFHVSSRSHQFLHFHAHLNITGMTETLLHFTQSVPEGKFHNVCRKRDYSMLALAICWKTMNNIQSVFHPVFARSFR